MDLEKTYKELTEIILQLSEGKSVVLKSIPLGKYLQSQGLTLVISPSQDECTVAGCVDEEAD